MFEAIGPFSSLDLSVYVQFSILGIEISSRIRGLICFMNIEIILKCWTQQIRPNAVTAADSC